MGMVPVRTGSVMGFDLEDILGGESPSHYLDGGNAIAIEPEYDEPWRPREPLGPGPTPLWAMSEDDRQANFRAQYERSLTIKNHGAHDELIRIVPQEMDPTYIVDGVFDPRANDVTQRTMQRNTGGEQFTRPDGSTGKRGGGRGGDSAGKAKPAKPYKPPTRLVATEPYVASIDVYGLTKGEKEFYAMRDGLARQILTLKAKQIIAGEYRINLAPLARRPKKLRLSMHVYGLRPLHHAALSMCPGNPAKEALSAHALECDAERIRYRDAIFESTAA